MSAALLNTHIRDNLLETSPAAVTAAGDIVYADAANSMARLAKGGAGQYLRMNAALTAPEWGGVIACRLRHSADQAVGTSTWTALTFDTEVQDTSDIHGTANPTRMTIPAGQTGDYLVIGNVAWEASALQSRRLAIRAQGTTYLADTTIETESAIAHRQQVSTIYEFTAGEYIELMAYQDHTSPLNILAESLVSPSFMLVRLV